MTVKFSPHGAPKLLAAAIRNLTALESLNVNYCLLSRSGTVALAPAVAECVRLTQLQFKDHFRSLEVLKGLVECTELQVLEMSLLLPQFRQSVGGQSDCVTTL